MTRPLLVIDGDSFAHRSYHALPKTIRRRGNKGGGAIVGFANFLLRLYEAEQPRAVLVGWDTLDEPTYRHRALEEYQSGREFDTELVDQLDVLPAFVAACGFANAKAPGYEADDFLAAAVAKEERRGPVIVATGDRDAYQLASARTTILQPWMRRCSTSRYPRGVAWISPKVQQASLSHGMWFHRPFRIDQWLPYSQHVASSAGGRAIARGSVFTRDGALVALVVMPTDGVMSHSLREWPIT